MRMAPYSPAWFTRTMRATVNASRAVSGLSTFISCTKSIASLHGGNDAMIMAHGNRQRKRDACRSRTSGSLPHHLAFRLLDRLPDIIRRRRHADIADAVNRERIHDRAHHDGGRRGGAAFAARLDAERIGGREHFRNPGD